MFSGWEYFSMRAYSNFFFFFNDTATTEIYTLSLHDSLPIHRPQRTGAAAAEPGRQLPARHAARRAADDPDGERARRRGDGEHRRGRHRYGDVGGGGGPRVRTVFHHGRDRRDGTRALDRVRGGQRGGRGDRAVFAARRR